jgi:TolA-binding protein
MAVVLVHPHERFQVSYRMLVQKSDLFSDDPTLAGSPYTPRSQVSLSDFREFVSALDGKTVTINSENFRGLSRLCDELQFRNLAAQLSQFRGSDHFKKETTMKDSEVRMRLSTLEERMQQRDDEIAALQHELSQQSRAQESVAEALLGRVARLEAEVSALKSAPVPGQAVPPGPACTAPLPKAQESTPASASVSGRPAPAPPSALNSVIVSDFPEIFAEFR